MSRNYRIPLLAATLLFLGGAAEAAAQGGTASPGRLTARSQALFTLSIDPNAAPGLPGSADAVAFDRGSRLYVLDRQSGFVYVFRPNGGLDLRIELRPLIGAPLQMTVTRDDRVVVSDAARQVFISIDPRNPGRSTTHPVVDMALTGPLAPHPDGGVVTQVRPLSESDLARGSIPPPQVVWFPLDGRSAVVLHAFPGTPGPRGTRNPLTPPPLAAALPDRGAVVALGDAYRLQVVRGGRAREIVRSISARAVTARDRQWAERQAACEQVFMAGPSGRAGANVRTAPPLRDAPARMPVIRGLGVDPEGRIWVERTPSDMERAGPVDVFAADGRLLGSVEGIGSPHAWAPDGQTAAFVTRDARCRLTVQVRRVHVAGPS